MSRGGAAAAISTASVILLGATASAALVGAADPVRPSPDEARRWAAEELAKPAYGKSSIERFLGWLNDLLSAPFQPESAPGAVPMPTLFAVLAVLLLAGIVAWLVRASRGKRTPAAAEPHAQDAVFAAKALPAAEYRRRARAALASGDAAAAVIEAFRAIAAGLLERHVLDEARDRTAREFATAAGAAFPQLAERFPPAARAFDATLYGGLPASAQTARDVLALDEDLQRATPRPVDPAGLPTPLAVPR